MGWEMNRESKLQKEIVRYLKSKKCYVIKTRPGSGTPVGCPDIIALLEGCWIALEVKASEKSPFQPLQEHTIEKLDDWSYAKAVFPENWLEIKAELDVML